MEITYEKTKDKIIKTTTKEEIFDVKKLEAEKANLEAIILAPTLTDEEYIKIGKMYHQNDHIIAQNQIRIDEINTLLNIK